MTQVWNTTAYANTGTFVPALGAGVLEWLGAREGERILDLGCGDGTLTEKIVAQGADVTGLDASSEMLKSAQERGLHVVLGNAEALPFEGEFDAVFSNAALHWVRDHEAMLAGVRRALKPGGRFVVEMGGQGNVAAILVALTAVLERYGCAGLEDGVNYYPAPGAYTKRLERHGFQVERMELIPRPTPLKTGMRAWLETFRSGVLNAVPDRVRERVIEDTVALLEPALRDEDGNWTADYVRLRFVAYIE